MRIKLFIRNLSTLVLLGGAGVALYFWQQSAQHKAEAPVVIPSPMVQAVASPVIHYPVPTEAELLSSPADDASPMPSLDESDSSVDVALTRLFGKKRFRSLFIVNDLIRRIVVSLDNVTEHQQLTEEFLFFKLLKSDFLVSGKGEVRTISSTNSQRYSAYLDLVKSLNLRELVAVYVHFYPLFQSAYEDLGTPGYFNDRVVEAVDHLLATPEPQGEIQVVRLKAQYKYKYLDNSLEALSCGQKVLIRMGRENAEVVKAKLRQLRPLLIHFEKRSKQN